MKKISTIGLTALFCIAGFSAAAETYVCELRDSRNSGWTPAQIVFKHVADRSVVKVYDEISYSTRKSLSNATLRAENSVRLVFQWSSGRYRNPVAKPTRDMPSIAPVQIFFEATLLRGGNKILLRAIPEGSTARYSARGACSVADEPVEAFIK